MATRSRSPTLKSHPVPECALHRRRTGTAPLDVPHREGGVGGRRARAPRRRAPRSRQWLTNPDATRAPLRCFSNARPASSSTGDGFGGSRWRFVVRGRRRSPLENELEGHCPRSPASRSAPARTRSRARAGSNRRRARSSSRASSCPSRRDDRSCSSPTTGRPRRVAGGAGSPHCPTPAARVILLAAKGTRLGLSRNNIPCSAPLAWHCKLCERGFHDAGRRSPRPGVRSRPRAAPRTARRPLLFPRPRYARFLLEGRKTRCWRPPRSDRSRIRRPRGGLDDGPGDRRSHGTRRRIGSWPADSANLAF